MLEQMPSDTPSDLDRELQQIKADFASQLSAANAWHAQQMAAKTAQLQLLAKVCSM